MEERGGFEFDERFAEAFFNVGSHRVLGKRLRPFCAWHRMQLEYLDNAFVLDDERPEPGDLRVAVAVCRTRFPQIVRLPRWLRGGGWWPRIQREAQSRRDAVRRDGAAFEGGVERFRAYLADYLSMPVLHVVNKSGGGAGGRKVTTQALRVPDMDETLLDVALYREITKCERAEPWEIPLGELAWMTAACSRVKGVDLRVTTTAEEARLRELKERKKGKEEAV